VGVRFESEAPCEIKKPRALLTGTQKVRELSARRVGASACEERIAALLQDSLAVAVKSGAMQPANTRRVNVDRTVQPKNVMFPTDAKLIHRAPERLVRLAKQVGLDCARPM
jgi:hypothetical protein